MTELKRQNPNDVMSKIIDVYSHGITRIKNYREYAKPHKMTIADGYDERTISEIEYNKQNAKVAELIQGIKNEVQMILDDYQKSENEYFKLDGSKITDDIKLLDLPLNEIQIKDLQARYKNNYTMLQAINSKAKEMNLAELIHQPTAERMELLNYWNEKLIYPRFTDNTEINPSKYNFAEQANLYQDMYQSKFQDDIGA